jgi:hypothetical protein
MMNASVRPTDRPRCTLWPLALIVPPLGRAGRTIVIESSEVV